MDMEPTPEQLLGMPVVAPGGRAVGTVVDVGLVTWRQPKFLLVKLPQAARIVRIEFGEVAEVGPRVVRLTRVPPDASPT